MVSKSRVELLNARPTSALPTRLTRAKIELCGENITVWFNIGRVRDASQRSPITTKFSGRGQRGVNSKPVLEMAAPLILGVR